MEKRTKLVVLGGGPAGIQATRMIKTQNPAWDVTMIRRERASMVYCAIPYALEGIIDREKVLKTDALVTDVGAELIRENATEVNIQERWVKTESGQVIHFEYLFFVPGSKSWIPPVPGAALSGVLTVKTEDDMVAIEDRLNGGAGKAVVIGAGAIGLEQAMAYKTRGLDVHVIDLADRILPHMSDHEMSAPLQEELISKGIILHLNQRLEAFIGDRHVTGIKMSQGEQIDLTSKMDFVVVAAGMKANLDLIEGQLEIGPDGVMVTPDMRTSVPYVFASGDVVQGWSGIDGKPLGGRLATNAVPMAKVAAMNIMGGDIKYPGLFNGSATVVGNLRIGGTGFTESFARSRGFDVMTATSETTSRFPMMPGATNVKVKLIADAKSGRIIGGQVTGTEAVAEKIDVITLAIQQKMTSSQLSELSYSAQPWQTFFPAKNAIVEAAMTLTIAQES